MDIKAIYNFLLHYWLIAASAIGLTWGVFAAALYGWFKKYGETWIEQKVSAKFSKELEAYKNTLAKDLEQYKVKTGALLARSVKQQEKEFEVLNEIWVKLKNAEGMLHDLMSAGQNFANITTFSPKRLRTYLEQHEFEEDDIERLLTTPSNDLQKAFEDKMMWYKLGKAEVARTDFHNYTIRNAPSMPKHISDKILKVSKEYQAALSAYRIGKESNTPAMRRDAYNMIFPQTDAIVDEIQELIQEYLHPE